jgi:hypothetical protein
LWPRVLAYASGAKYRQNSSIGSGDETREFVKVSAPKYAVLYEEYKESKTVTGCGRDTEADIWTSVYIRYASDTQKK